MADGMFTNYTPWEMQQAYAQQVAGGANASPYERIGARLGTSLGALFGGRTAAEARQSKMQDIMEKATKASTDPVERLQIAQGLAAQSGMNDLASSLQQELNNQLDLSSKLEQRKSVAEEKKGKAALAGREEANRVSLGNWLSNKLPGMTPEAGYTLAGDSKAVTELIKQMQGGDVKTSVVNADGRQKLINSATGALIADLGASQQSDISGLTQAIKQQQLEDMKLKNASAAEKAAAEKSSAVRSLVAAESDIEDSLTAAEAAGKIAPKTLLGASVQATSSAIPWSDSKALANLVATLNSGKTLETLRELKTQSRTGATGFGALSEKELNVVEAKIRTLDPTDKNFRENLAYVVNKLNETRDYIRSERSRLKGDQKVIKLP